MVFSTSDRLLSDVLLLSKVREFVDFQCISGRPWETVGGRGRLCSPDWLREIRSDQKANQGSKASHDLPQPWPPTFCHLICLSQSEEHGLSRTRPPTASHDRTLPGKAMRLAVKSVTRPQGSDSLARCT